MLVTEAVLKEHIGGIQTKLNMATVLPFVKIAEFGFRKEIGKELFKKLPDYPISADDAETQELQEDLKYWALSCISWAAYDMAVPHLKIRVGDLGMMKTSPANSVSITKWEYVDTRESNMFLVDLAKEYFFDMLEELNPDEWSSSDACKLRNELFINSPQMLGNYVVLAGKNIRLFNKIAVYIKSTEELYISELITEGVFTELKTKIIDGTALSVVEKKLLELIRKALAPLAIQEATPYLQLKIDEDGMREIRKKDGIREEEIADKGYRNKLIIALDGIGALYLARLRKFMDATASVTVFPTYYAANLVAEETEDYNDFTNKSHVIL